MKKYIFFIPFLVILAIGIYLLILNNQEILVEKTMYNYPYKEVLKIDDTGRIYESKIIDELTLEGSPKGEFKNKGVISNEDLLVIKNIINKMKNEEMKKDNFSESYGIAVNIGKEYLYGCEYFHQEMVDELNLIIEKYE